MANLENTHIINHAGVNVINVGSTIAKSPNPQETFEKLNAETEKEDIV